MWGNRKTPKESPTCVILSTLCGSSACRVLAAVLRAGAADRGAVGSTGYRAKVSWLVQWCGVPGIMQELSTLLQAALLQCCGAAGGPCRQ